MRFVVLAVALASLACEKPAPVVAAPGVGESDAPSPADVARCGPLGVRVRHSSLRAYCMPDGAWTLSSNGPPATAVAPVEKSPSPP